MSSSHEAYAGSKGPAAEELVARARALAPRLRERAVQAERDRNIPKQSVEEYIDAGLMRTITPRRWGGYEHDHEVAFDIAIELGRSTCGSSAWCLNYMSDHLGILAHFPEQAQSDVWSDGPDVGIATPAAPTGKAQIASGGYRLDGKWSWCSGITHCQWIMIGGLIFARATIILTCVCSWCRPPTSRCSIPGIVRGCAARDRTPRSSTTCSCPSIPACRSRRCAMPARRDRG